MRLASRNLRCSDGTAAIGDKLRQESQEGEKKTVQKSGDDFLDKDAKPDERQHPLAEKLFFYRCRQSKIRGRLRATLHVCHSADVHGSVYACSAGF